MSLLERINVLAFEDFLFFFIYLLHKFIERHDDALLGRDASLEVNKRRCHHIALTEYFKSSS
jgi:hypothetical protein